MVVELSRLKGGTEAFGVEEIIVLGSGIPLHKRSRKEVVLLASFEPRV